MRSPAHPIYLLKNPRKIQQADLREPPASLPEPCTPITGPYRAKGGRQGDPKSDVRLIGAGKSESRPPLYAAMRVGLAAPPLAARDRVGSGRVPLASISD